MHTRVETSRPGRIKLTDRILKNFFDNIFPGTVSELATVKGLSYTLVYNLVHGRIHSISPADYRRIFGEAPPYQEPKRVDGTFFREMVRVWLYLNEEITEADLYKEFHKGKNFKRVDYRIFTGEVRTIHSKLERMMEQKFLNPGFNRSEIREGIAELKKLDEQERIPYEDIKPALDYLEESLAVNPSHILNQWSARYESGELKTVTDVIYDYASDLKRRTEEAIKSGSRLEREKLREEIYGRRKGLTLFSEVEEELQFLQKHAGKSPKRYLGRSISVYKKSKLKRIASQKAQKIKDDCCKFIEQRPEFTLPSIPKSYAKHTIRPLVSVLRSYLIRRTLGGENKTHERDLLRPSRHSKEEYTREVYGFTSVDKAARALGMSQGAFDLLLCEHSDVFRRMGTYDEKWYLPDLYLKEIVEKEGFDLIVSKYEFLAKNGKNHSCS